MKYKRFDETAALLLLIGFGIAGSGIFTFYSLGNTRMAKIELEKARLEKEYVLQERDLNGNGIPERFYEIGGSKVFLSYDGVNIESKLKE